MEITTTDIFLFLKNCSAYFNRLTAKELVLVEAYLKHQREYSMKAFLELHELNYSVIAFKIKDSLIEYNKAQDKSMSKHKSWGSY